MSNIFEEFEKEKELLELQKKYEDGIILEQELTEEEKNLLINLYKQQIEILNNNINTYKKRLNDYKEKILKVKKKVIFKNQKGE